MLLAERPISWKYVSWALMIGNGRHTLTPRDWKSAYESETAESSVVHTGVWTGQLDNPYRDAGRHAIGHRTHVVIGVREEDGPGVSDELVESDLANGSVGLVAVSY